MYTLAPGTTRHFPSVYMTSAQRTAHGALATTTSDAQLHVLDVAQLQGRAWDTQHGRVSAVQNLGGVVCTAGEDGCVCVWDARAGGRVARIQACDGPIAAMACEASTHTIAVGTEMYEHNASILLWDLRSTPQLRTRYTELHSDDVTALSTHPSRPHLLLSGSADGLVSVHDTRVADDDDTTLMTRNLGAAVHCAGFVAGHAVYALSTDEIFAVYGLDASEGGGVQGDSGQEDGVQGDNMQENGMQGDSVQGEQGDEVRFGDLRQGLACRYVADVLPKTDGSGAVLGAGSQDQEAFNLVFLARGASWAFDPAASVGLPGAHGGEVVRAFCFFDEHQLVVTAGEDGCVKTWRPGS